jgi:2-desacetyl-2-hydroxyethyl bacteriochlorophyllide A dehydrogenase
MSQLISTVILDEPGHLRLTDTPAPPEPGPGETLVRVHSVGICGTDIHAFNGRQPFFTYPRILGHELGVEVLAIGEGVVDLMVGDRCSVEPYLHCGSCIACRQGRTNCCAMLSVLGVHSDGGMRERIIVPAQKLHRSAALSYEELALVETLAIGAHAVQRAAIVPGECALVVGAGPIGLGTMQFAHLAGAKVIALDLSPERLAFCQAQGVTAATVDGREDPLPALLELTGGDMPTVVFDATGSARSMERSFDYPAPGGRLVFVGLVQGTISFNDPSFHRRELTLLATRNALAENFTTIIGQLESSAIDSRPWITHRAAHTEFIEAFPGWLAPDSGIVKGVVSF